MNEQHAGDLAALEVGPVARPLVYGLKQGGAQAYDAVRVIGVLHLARSGVGLRAIAPGVAEAFPLSPAEVRAACVQVALVAAGTD